MQAEPTPFAPLGASALSSIDGGSIVEMMEELNEIRDCVWAVWGAVGDFVEEDPKMGGGIRLILKMIADRIDGVAEQLDVHLVKQEGGAA